MSPDDSPDDLAALEAETFATLFSLIRLRLKAAVEQRLQALEEATGRELHEVRAQLGQLYPVPRELPPAGAGPRAPRPESAAEPPKRGPGRPRKTPTDGPAHTDDSPTL